MPVYNCTVCGCMYEDFRPLFPKAHPFVCSTDCLGAFLATPEDRPITNFIEINTSARSKEEEMAQYKSTYEADFASFLKKRNIPFFYEGHMVRLYGDVMYVPDFYLPNVNLYIEVKGYLDQRGRSKLLKFLNQYPLSLLYLDKKSLRRFKII